ncbi:MAG TPA: TetR/AcrR family transcriptional regulator [Deltaproteobacteria bacterium]|jgi:AcrR family transcriptional regulator|nr:TetR/AcrR family transcriptional regulator [Deltaproteobacteria bacterium]HOI07641.1 TetR/AcrR family transcriptional regulator [Deltaproteobacteria bacterium]
MKVARSAHELEQVRKRILDEALSIIATQGFDALTVRRLAARSGMTAPNLYNYFANKDEIYLTLVITGFEKLHGELKGAYASSDDPVRRAHALMEAYVRFGIENSAYYDIMFTRATPKYNDYVGTPHERLSRIEYAISMEIVALAERAVAEVNGGEGRKGREGHTKDVVKVWCTLHGMVSLCNSHIVGYVAGDTQAVYHRILEELIESVVS